MNTRGIAALETELMFLNSENPAFRTAPARPEDLFEAAKAGDRDRVLRLLRRDPGLAQARNGEGRTALHLAVLHRHADAAQLLLSRGADVNARTPCGSAPLHHAAQRGFALLVGLLLNAGANPQAKDLWGNTPRERALERGHRTIARMLLRPASAPSGGEGRGRLTPARERNRPVAPRLLHRIRRSRAVART